MRVPAVLGGRRVRLTLTLEDEAGRVWHGHEALALLTAILSGLSDERTQPPTQAENGRDEPSQPLVGVL